jgi:hypothetical protein
VGVFAACSLASPKGNTSEFIREFNQNGMDAIVASPFPIPAAYGTRLAIEFTPAVHDARQSEDPTTVSELFSIAIQRTALRLRQDLGRHYDDMGLEFEVLGDPGIKLCKQSPQRRLQ